MDINVINQNDYPNGSSYCLASCHLAIAQYFGYDITMQDLIDEGVVRYKDGYVYGTGGYFTKSAKKTYNITNVKKEIDKGNPVIISGKSTPTINHFVVAYDYSGSSIYVMDPWGGKFGTLGKTTLKSTEGYFVCTE